MADLPTFRLITGDCIEVMAEMDPASMDAIVTDPPYGLEFMGKEWDRFRSDDPGTARHRGARAGDHGELVEPEVGLPSRPSGVLYDRTKAGPRGVGYGGTGRAKTNRCVACGKRDQFRNVHEPCGAGTWKAELLDPHAAPPTLLAYQNWTRAWALEALRVLKPGGHLLAFGGTRTYHRLACAIEDAGFEIRDCLAWMYGSGFPKSHNVGKAIESHLTSGKSGTVAKRRAIMGDDYEPSEAMGKFLSVERAMANVRTSSPEYVLTHPDAQRWHGWGTALKPAYEPIVLARKPLVGTVAGNVLEHGTGALNVDGCRVEATDGGSRVSTVRSEDGINKIYGRDMSRPGPVEYETPSAGRWPANVLLDEQAAAMLDEQTGEVGSTLKHNYEREYPDKGGTSYRFDKKHVTTHADTGGASRFFKVVRPEGDDETWTSERANTAEPSSDPPRPSGGSVPGPAPASALPALDLPSSPGPSTSATPSGSSGNDGSGTPQTPTTEPGSSPGSQPTRPTPSSSPASDAANPEPTATTTTTPAPSTSDGSAVPAISNTMLGRSERGEADSLPRAFYTAKASSAERNRGVEWMEPQVMKLPGKATGFNPETGELTDGYTGERRNTHPTVKPVDLMQWLCRLITPPGGTVLDPFTGSGSTGIAALREGFEFIGIEREPDYVEIARARIVGDAPLFNVEEA